MAHSKNLGNVRQVIREFLNLVEVVVVVAVVRWVETPKPTSQSVGHPRSCGPACRYVKRKGGCRDGFGTWIWDLGAGGEGVAA